MSKQFHVSDVLSITTGRLVSNRLIEGVYDILNHMTGDSLFTHQLPRASDECKPWLLRQHPILDDPRISVMAIGTLALMLESDCIKTNDDRKHLIIGWMSKYIYPITGEYLDIDPIPSDDHARRDPVTELEGMIGKERVIVIHPDEV